MSNIFMNLVESIITNPITILFIIIITGYSILKIQENNKLYDFIMAEVKDMDRSYNMSNIYNLTHSKYERYQVDYPNLDINITTFIEEVISTFKFKDNLVLEKIKHIKDTSSTCILLGVLGTFIGLSTMLLGLDTQNIIESLPTTISSMQTAFITSIFGIISSIIVNAVIRRKDCEHLLTNLMLKLENLMTSKISNENAKKEDEKIEDIKNTIKHISKSIESIEKFDQISKDLNEFNNEFINGIETLKELLEGSQYSIKTFDQSVRKMDNQFSILNMKFSKLFDKYDGFDNKTESILVQIKETSKSIETSTDTQYKVRDYIKNMNASFGLYERYTKDLLDKLIVHERNMMSQQEDLMNEKVNLHNTVKVLNRTVSTSTKNIGDKLDTVFTYLDLYKEAKDYVKHDKFNNSLAKREQIYATLIQEDDLYD